MNGFMRAGTLRVEMKILMKNYNKKSILDSIKSISLGGCLNLIELTMKVFDESSREVDSNENGVVTNVRGFMEVKSEAKWFSSGFSGNISKSKGDIEIFVITFFVEQIETYKKSHDENHAICLRFRDNPFFNFASEIVVRIVAMASINSAHNPQISGM